MELYYLSMFNDVSIFPAANDASCPIGAAAYVYEHMLGGKMRKEKLTHVYLGLEYLHEEIKKIIEKTGSKRNILVMMLMLLQTLLLKVKLSPDIKEELNCTLEL